jgi:hypothetical protein
MYIYYDMLYITGLGLWKVLWTVDKFCFIAFYSAFNSKTIINGDKEYFGRWVDQTRMNRIVLLFDNFALQTSIHKN